MTISCSGVTAGQYVFNIFGQGGLSQLNRVQSISYQNLLSLVMTYKNNGVIYERNVPGSVGTPVLAVSLFIYYDDKVYIGSFDSFTVEDDANQPYNLSYSFRFTVRYEIDVNSLSSGVGTGI